MVRCWPQIKWKDAAPLVATIKNDPSIAKTNSLIFGFVSMFSFLLLYGTIAAKFKELFWLIRNLMTGLQWMVSEQH
jgi:hypothetical protein